MGLSETILAAMIGAIATVSTALFQIFTAFKARGKFDTKPRRGSTFRSILAVMALMVASAAGGFLYSEFLKQRSGEDMRAMRAELKELTAALTRQRDQTGAESSPPAPAALGEDALVPASMDSAAGNVESVVYVPACRRADPLASCQEHEAQRIALCGTIPGYARVQNIDLFVQPDAVQHPWEQHRATFEQDLGGARFTGKSFEYAQGQDAKAVCVNFTQWSSDHPHIARIVVQYGFGEPAPLPEATPATIETTPVQTPAVIAAEALPTIPQPVSFAGKENRL